VPPVEPDRALEVCDELPVAPDAPPLPVVARLEDVGLATALPVVPPVAAPVVVDAPVAPVCALPIEAAVAAPDVPPVEVAVAAPELPVMTVTATAPLPPPPLEAPEKVFDAPAVPPPAPPPTPPAVAVAGPPGPLVAVTTGALVAFPELPVVPPTAVAVPVALPLVAVPVVLELFVAGPEVPPGPDGPVVDPPVPVAAPEPPLGAVGAAVATAGAAGATSLGVLLSAASKASAARVPDMTADGTRPPPPTQPYGDGRAKRTKALCPGKTPVASPW